MVTSHPDMWTQCYNAPWQGLVVPDALGHPAKFSRALIQRIYQHALAEGWLTPGMAVLDPFGGVSLGALDAALAGVQHVAVELEPRFHALAQENVALWERKYGHLPQWVRPVCVQGDSRELLRVLQGAEVDCCVSSPPYADAVNAHNEGPGMPGNARRRKAIQAGSPGEHAAQSKGVGYGSTPGNLGNMPSGMVEAVVSSPPWAGSLAGGDGVADKNNWFRERLTDGGKIGQSCNASYGSTPGNLGNMAPGMVETEQSSTFWAAARTILAQCFALIAPGGHAIWVVKSYCRDGAIVDFPGQWRAVCEDVGFVTLHEHHAMLVEHHGTQGGLFGEDTTHTTERKSFFRRLHEAKRPDLAIDYEVVLCMVKPHAAGGVPQGSVTVCVSSPPYAHGLGKEHNYVDHAKREKASHRRIMTEKGIADPYYGSHTGQLGNMPLGSVALVVSSPPYVQSIHHGNGIDQTKLTGHRPGPHTQATAEGYGTTPGQLGNMPPGSPEVRHAY